MSKKKKNPRKLTDKKTKNTIIIIMKTVASVAEIVTLIIITMEVVALG